MRDRNVHQIGPTFFRGLIEIGETFYQKSIYGGVFSALAIREIDLQGTRAIIPRVSCSDVHITGFNHLVTEEDDKLKNGFVSW